MPYDYVNCVPFLIVFWAFVLFLGGYRLSTRCGGEVVMFTQDVDGMLVLKRRGALHRDVLCAHEIFFVPRVEDAR